MDSWIERFQLFRYAILAALCAGAVCPLLGAFLYLRRSSFYGITLPQFATAGVAFGFVALPWWMTHIGIGDLTLESAQSDTHAAMNYHESWAAAFTFGGLLWLDFLARRGGNDIGRVAGAFAIASAASILFCNLSPVGAEFVDELLKGEILGVGRHEFETMAVVLGFVLAAFWFFQRELLFISYDREMAQVLGKRVLAFETLMTIITGLSISIGTMALGPTILFGLLVLPPIAARVWARSMSKLLWLSSLFGIASVVLGIVASFSLNAPLGAAVVAVAALLHVPGFVAKRWMRA